MSKKSGTSLRLDLLLGPCIRHVLIYHLLSALGADFFRRQVEEIDGDGHPLVDLVPEPWACVHLVKDSVGPRKAHELLPVGQKDETVVAPILVSCLALLGQGETHHGNRRSTELEKKAWDLHPCLLQFPPLLASLVFPVGSLLDRVPLDDEKDLLPGPWRQYLRLPTTSGYRPTLNPYSSAPCLSIPRPWSFEV